MQELIEVRSYDINAFDKENYKTSNLDNRGFSMIRDQCYNDKAQQYQNKSRHKLTQPFSILSTTCLDVLQASHNTSIMNLLELTYFYDKLISYALSD